MQNISGRIDRVAAPEDGRTPPRANFIFLVGLGWTRLDGHGDAEERWMKFWRCPIVACAESAEPNLSPGLVHIPFCPPLRLFIPRLSNGSGDAAPLQLGFWIFGRPSGLEVLCGGPGVETPGYCRISLRDNSSNIECAL